MTRLDAADKGEARKLCERDEFARAAFALSDDAAAELLDRAGVEVQGSGEKGAVTSRDLKAALDELPRSAALAAPGEEKAAFRALGTADRARLHAHFQEQPYTVASVEKVG